jgi:hypothetical protein
MNIQDVLNRAGLGYLTEHIKEHDKELANADIQIHYQESYPLLGGISNVVATTESQLLDDSEYSERDKGAEDKEVLVIALYQSRDYGSKKAWEL